MTGLPWWGDLLLGVGVALLAAWLALVVVLLAVRRRLPDHGWREVLRLLPDVVRLVRRLAADPEVPRAVRWGLVALGAYLVVPVDLVPDFLPVIGWADDAIAVVLVLRWAVRRAGPDAVRRHWPGTDAGLAVLRAAVGLPGGTSPRTDE
ncbi:YkvA family protein [Isoptericola sp. BMS4]|uniref:YkvA family protein n=1 Tax=Isoptericola sp. BMS4 TaxID=2527875 RepID=UPI001424742F|nr:DUF1232 domain-containing protein [Isoptericola sp. BMS4]